MPTYAQLTANRAPAIMGTGDDALHLEYYPLRITSEHLRRFAELSVMQETLERRVANLEAIEDKGERAEAVIEEAVGPLDAVIDILLDILASWDLTETPDGEPLPITRDVLEPLGLGLNAAIVATIFTTRNAGIPKVNGTRSSTNTSGTSTRRARKTTSRGASSRTRSR